LLAQAYAGPVQAFILAKVAKLYPVANLFPALPPVLHAIATRETIYRCALGRLMTQVPPSQAGKSTMIVQHEEDMKLLGEIADGAFPLLSSSEQLIEPSLANVEIYSTTMDFNPTFHEGALVDQVIDTEKLDAIIEAREDRGL
jgi:hypothetical protein